MVKTQAPVLALILAAGLCGRQPPAQARVPADPGRGTGAGSWSIASARNTPQPAYEKLQALTDANAASLLLKEGTRSVVIVYSSRQHSQRQTAQLEMVLRQSRTYTGAVSFYRLDHAQHPKAWQDITMGRPWTQGPVFILVRTSPAMIGTVSDKADQPIHDLSSARLKAEIFRFFSKLQLPVEHVNLENVDRDVIAAGLPTFLMAYRSRSAFNDQAQFQRFVYESQLYANRVKFVMVDLDEGDLSRHLGVPLPRRDAPYFVLYKPATRTGSMLFEPALSTQGMEKAIRDHFGLEPARVIP